MSNLSVFDLYEQESEQTTTRFLNNTKSEIRVNTDFEKVELDTEWIEELEMAVPHIDAILKNPNRFIINEEEVVKIEKAKRVTVESIKDLAKHTNFIQAIDEEGVKPAIIININKEETFDTYENRLIYTLIQNSKNFISIRKEALLGKLSIQAKDEKKFTYNGHTVLGNEAIGISFEISSKKQGDSKNNTKDILDRIEHLELEFTILTQTEVYKSLAKAHAALVRPPVKKTNMILKNKHFQYAMRLWNYIQENLDDRTKRTTDKDQSDDNQAMIRYGNETFLLNYLALNTLSQIGDEEQEEKSKEARDFITNQLIEQLIIVNPDLTPEELETKITGRIAQIRTAHTATLAELRKIFKERFDKFIDKVESNG